MKTNLFSRIGLIVLALVAVVSVASAQLPSVQLKDMSGKTVDTGKLKNGGRPMVISFWATWCKPCLRELKAIHELYPDWQDETGVKMIIVSVDQAQDVQKVRPLVDGMGWEYDVLLDPNGDFKRLMQVQNVPHVFVVDGKGKIVYNHAGYTDGGENELYEVLKKL